MVGRVKIGGLKWLAAVLAITFCHPSVAHAWPRLTGSNSHECRQTFELAKAAFQSDEPVLYVPPTMPESFGSTISVKPAMRDISGGDAVVADDSVFQKIFHPVDSFGGSIYWQITPQFGRRLAVVDQPFNWAGDWYALYSLDQSATPDELFAEQRREDGELHFKPIIHQSWIPPLILTDKVSGNSWAVVQGGSWIVYTTDGDGTQSRCTIGFQPKLGRAVYALPPAVQRFAAMLDEALGPGGRGEGTLRPTARIRNRVNLLWGNVALRPWALNESPYNTREEVDEGLRMWTYQDPQYPKRSALYTRITRQYPRAESALAGYYRTTFRLPAPEARTMAVYATDLMFRKYFTFHGVGNPLTVANPWKELRKQ